MENMVRLFELLTNLKQNGHNNAEYEVSYLGPQSQMSTMIIVDKVRPTCPLRRGSHHLSEPEQPRLSIFVFSTSSVRGSSESAILMGYAGVQTGLFVMLRYVCATVVSFTHVSCVRHVRSRMRGTCSISHQVVCAQEFKVYQAGPKAAVV